MQKVVCTQCGGQWYIDAANSSQMRCCLYCEKPLHQKKEITTLDSLDKIIFKAVSSLGTDAFAQPHQLTGYMMDIAPDYKKEYRILGRTFCDEYSPLLRDAFTTDMSRAVLLINKLKTLLIDEDGLSESWANVICESYLGAIRYSHGVGLENVLLVSIEEYDPFSEVKHTSHHQDSTIAPFVESFLSEGRMLCARRAYSDAAKLFYKAAQMGNAAAQYELGRLYLLGKGVKRNEEIADELLGASADAGYVPAFVQLGKIRYQKKQYKNAWKWFHKAAEENEPTALFYAYLFFSYGYHVKQSESIARRYLVKAATAGSLEAKLELKRRF